MKKILSSLLTVFLACPSPGNAEDYVTPGITVISPTSDQIVQPNEDVPVEVQIDSSIDANLMVVSIIAGVGTGDQPFTEIFGPPFQTTMTIPEKATGKVLFQIMLFNDAIKGSLGGADIRVNVVPAEAPAHISSEDKYYRLNPPNTDGSFSDTRGMRKISVDGFYGDGLYRNLTSPLVGTTYASSDINVVTVTSEGILEPVAPGRAYITIEHMGLKAYAEIIVQDPALDSLPPIDVTNRVAVERSGFRRDLSTGLFRQAVKLTNVSEFPLSGLNLVLVNLTDGVRLTNARGVTENILPLGSAYVRLSLPMGDPFLDQGESKTLELEFANPQGKSIDYGVMVVEGSEP